MSGFHTLARPVEISGIGLHCGSQVGLRIAPDERAGWRFARLDLPQSPEVVASVENVTATRHATVLAQGQASVSTTEHLLAALWALDVTHARIELDGPEVPILDGSALPWVEAIKAAGLQPIDGPRPLFGLKEMVWWEGGGASVVGVPHDEFRLSVAVDFDHPHAGAQSVDFSIDGATFEREIAPARTFTLENWLEPLRGAGLIRGGSLDNAVVVNEMGLSSAPRLENEMARHKALDCIGDFALLFGANGGALCAHLIALRAGHGPHRAWMESCQHQNALLRF